MKLRQKLFPFIDKLFRDIDRQQIRRTKNLRLIPEFANRRGGKLAYSEWAHVIGIFQSLIYQNIKEKKGNNILDIGCGTGLLGISSEPYTSENGSYTGIDVMKDDITFCQQNFTMDHYKFLHFDIANPRYAANQNKELMPWPIEDNSKDLVLALSVWTHLKEEDARFYFKEIARVLKTESRAIITFFYLDEDYQSSLAIRENKKGRFHATSQMNWIFDQNAYDSNNWFTTKLVRNPEDAIAITPEAMKLLIQESGLKVVQHFPGNWKEKPGLYFQDVFVFEK
tara:strand:- start:896 stop:1741 length:846 start_codon:yes stop_codon:yes gene_type:complete